MPNPRFEKKFKKGENVANWYVIYRRFLTYLPALGQQSVASTGIHTMRCMDAKTIGFCTMKLHNMMHIHVHGKI